ncbi:hypothetical protein N0V90_004299 [Kalmusia sp. IMI 367209]|nr:hypothetical protein N0V90_004299 [Kalmusia sp. IMI 367209]
MSAKPLPLIPWTKTNILEQRNSQDASRIALDAALDLMVLGYPAHANRLVDSLYNAGNGILFDTRRNLSPLFQAWEATDSMATYIRTPDPNKLYNGFDDTENGKKLRESLKNGESLLWPSDLREKNYSFSREDVKFVLENLSMHPGNGLSSITTAIGVALDVTIVAGYEDKARKLIEEDIVSLFKYFQDHADDEEVSGRKMRYWMNKHLGIEGCTKAWKLIQETAVGERLGIEDNSLDAYVEEGCRLIEERFTKGPARPYATKSIPELLRIMDESYIAARRANSEAGGSMSIFNIVGVIDDEDGGNLETKFPKTFLKEAATDDQISELERRIGGDKEEEKEGQGEKEEEDRRPMASTQEMTPSDVSGIFYAASNVDFDDDDLFNDIEFTLSPWSFTDVHFDNFAFPKGMKLFSIGAGGDEGQVWLLQPKFVRKMVEKFEETYAKANERDKRLYERAALDLYGVQNRESSGVSGEYLELEAVPYAVQMRKVDQDRKAKRKREDLKGEDSYDEEQDGDYDTSNDGDLTDSDRTDGEQSDNTSGDEKVISGGTDNEDLGDMWKPDKNNGRQYGLRSKARWIR